MKAHVSIAIFSVLIIASSVAGQDKPRDIIEKAIKAHGGEAKVAKLRTMRIKVEGTTDLVPGQRDLAFTLEDMCQLPGRYRTSSTFQFMGRRITQTQVVDGDKGWIQSDGQTQDMSTEALAEMKEQMYAEDLDHLQFLNDKGIEISLIKEIKVEGKPAVGIVAKSKGHRDVKLYFDKTSGLLSKREHPLLESPSGKLVLQEMIFSDYQEKDGVKFPNRLIAYRDGKKVINAKVIEIEFLEKVNEKFFGKP